MFVLVVLGSEDRDGPGAGGIEDGHGRLELTNLAMKRGVIYIYI
jgi:hypothetical protein